MLLCFHGLLCFDCCVLHLEMECICDDVMWYDVQRVGQAVEYMEGSPAGSDHTVGRCRLLFLFLFCFYFYPQSNNSSSSCRSCGTDGWRRDCCCLCCDCWVYKQKSAIQMLLDRASHQIPNLISHILASQSGMDTYKSAKIYLLLGNILLTDLCLVLLFVIRLTHLPVVIRNTWFAVLFMN